jgi:phosphoserine phosphatase RsbU/P
MTIRRRLLSLLLIVSLVPFAVTFALRQLSARMTRHQVSSKVEFSLDRSARTTLLQQFEQFNKILKREYLLMDSLIQRQAREAILCLETNASTTTRLEGMLDVYPEIYRLSPSGFYAQSTVLKDGHVQTYPQLKTPVDRYDPQQQPWFLEAQKEKGIVRVGPYVDLTAGETLYTIALAIRDEQGAFQGATALHRTLPDLFANVVLPEQWAEGAQTMAVVLDPNTSGGLPDLIVVIHARYMETDQQSGAIQRTRLTLEESDVSRAMIQDMQTRQSGVCRMSYLGQDSLWAYGNALESGLVPIVIVSYDRVTELVTDLESFILGKSIFWWQIGGAVLLLIFVAVILVGVAKARAITHPIGTLSQACGQLAAGDYQIDTRIQTGDELQALGETFNEIGPHLAERVHMKRSLEVAKVVQQDLLPKANPQMRHFEIGATCVYCDQTGGDYYDFINFGESDPDKLGIALGDVSGHGIGAALLMASARGIFRNSARHYHTRLMDLFSHSNQQLVQDSAADKFITLFYGILDDSDQSLIWASGGHDPALWYHQDADTFEELPNTGPPVGLFEDVSFSQLGPIHLLPGDMLVVGTDGIWEAQNENKEMFGKDRFWELIREHRHVNAQALADKVAQVVTAYIQPRPADDDVTLLVVKVKSSQSEP